MLAVPRIELPGRSDVVSGLAGGHGQLSIYQDFLFLRGAVFGKVMEIAISTAEIANATARLSGMRLVVTRRDVVVETWFAHAGMAAARKREYYARK